MRGATTLAWWAVMAAVLGWSRAGAGDEVLHLIHTSEVRGTVGICG